MPRAPPRTISRFIVMAMLQAARAKRMGLPRDSAYSWGLNRAIFFAAAKQGFRSPGAAAGSDRTGAASDTSRTTYLLGRDLAYRDPTSSTLYFTIGGETQTEKDFEKQIVARFGGAENFERAWSEAEAIVGAADPDALESGSAFYAEVYKPRRDALRAKWTEMIGGPPPKLPD